MDTFGWVLFLLVAVLLSIAAVQNWLSEKLTGDILKIRKDFHEKVWVYKNMPASQDLFQTLTDLSEMGNRLSVTQVARRLLMLECKGALPDRRLTAEDFVDDAYRSTALCLTHHLLHRTIRGRVLSHILWIETDSSSRPHPGIHQIVLLIERWLRSGDVQDYYHELHSPFDTYSEAPTS
jgi:hypothetical protein